MAETRVEGLKELRAKLLALPREVRGRPLRNALFSAGKIMRDEAVRLVAKRSGKLARNIILALANQRDGSLADAGVVLTVRQTGKKEDARNAFYARFVEFGHRARPKRGAAGTEAYQTTGRGAYGVGGFSDERHTRRLNYNLTRFGRSAGAKGSAAAAPGQIVPAQPFLRPAAESKKNEFFAGFAAAMRIELDKVVAKLARKGIR